MVTVLTAVMIGGLVLIVALVVIRIQDRGPVLPETITLPDGTTPVAVTTGEGWHAVVTGANEILVFDSLTGALRQTVVIDIPSN